MIWISLFSCKGKRDKNTISMNDPGRPISELKEMALLKGDTNAYDRLSIAHLDLPIEEFIPIAQEMAEKHKYPQAYFDVYWSICETGNINEESSNEK